MSRHFFTFLLMISFVVVSAFACEPQEEKQNFFPKKFSKEQMQALVSQGVCLDNFKVYTLEKKDHEILKSYVLSTIQVYSALKNPLEGRVEFQNASYKKVEDYSLEIASGFKETGTFKTFVGKYTVQGAYGGYSPSAEIDVIGSYDLFHLILSNEKFNENGLCIHRLYELDDSFTQQTFEIHRLNQTLSKLFYVRKALQQPDKYRLVYDDTAEELGRKWCVEYMKEKEISDQVCMAVLLKQKSTDPSLISLNSKFYSATINALRDDIYSLLGINKMLLQSMYEGVGQKKIASDYIAYIQRI